MKKTQLLSSIVLAALGIVYPIYLQAEIKMKSLQELESGIKEAADTVENMALYLSGGGLAVAIIYVVYVLATNHPKAREHIVAVVAALVFYLLAINVIF